MTKLQPVHCRYCKKEIDRNVLEENIDWIITEKNWFWHLDCYKEKMNADKIRNENISNGEGTEEEWFDMLWRYLKKDLKISVNFIMIKKQWDSYLAKKMTPKGIYLCVKYMYDVKKINPEKGNGGIGLVPWLYEECHNYWKQREHQFKIVCEEIKQQIEEMRTVQAKSVPKSKKTPKKKQLINLQDIFEEE